MMRDSRIRPADPNDSMTETDVMTTYPELRSL